MAHTYIPNNNIDIHQKYKYVYDWVIDKQKDLFKNNNITSIINDPLAIDIKTDSIKIHRKLQPYLNISNIKLNYKVVFGNGTRGNTGTNNRGLIFENILLSDLSDYTLNRDNDNYVYHYNSYIYKLHNEFLSKSDRIKIKHLGKANSKRPLVFENNNIYIYKKLTDIGNLVSDITIETDFSDINLSLKLGNNAKIFNVGINKYIKVEEIEKSEIINKFGLELLLLLGIDKNRFIKVFDDYKNNIICSKEIIDITHEIDLLKLHEFLSSGFGYGYYLIKTENISSKNIEDIDLTDKATVYKITKPVSITIEYPAGTSKTITLKIRTDNVIFKLEIRNKKGGIYPNEITSSFIFK